MVEALSTVPLLGFPEEWPDDETDLSLTGPGGEDVVVELSSNGWDWSLTVSIGVDPAEVAEISSEYAEDARLMYRSDLDGWESPVQIGVEQGDLSSSTTDWSLAAWTLARLTYDTPPRLGSKPADP